MRHVVRVQRRPQGAWKDQVVFPPGRSNCDPLLSQTSAVTPQQFNQFRRRKRVLRERAVLSSPITRRVRSLEVSVRSRTRFTACVTFRVADSQSRADQCRPNASPRRSPNASITVSNGSSPVPCTCSRRALAWSTESARPSSLRTRGAAERAAALRETRPSRSACLRARRSTARMMRTVLAL